MVATTSPPAVDQWLAPSQTRVGMHPLKHRQQAIYKIKQLSRLYLLLVTAFLLWPIVPVPAPF